MTAAEVQLVSIRYENVRGFYDATLPLENEKTLIVGRNHAGKTSALLLLAWLINDADPGRLFQNDELTADEQGLLLPARHARHRARRITLTVYISDGRTARSFESDRNYAMLRVGFRVSGKPTAFIQLGAPTRSSGDQSDVKAKELLDRIQDIYSVIHIPSARDATSLQFRSRFRNLFRDKLSERALHPGKQAGATTEYRKIVSTTRTLKTLAETLLNPLLESLANSLPTGMLRSQGLAFKEGIEQSVVDWIVDQVTLKLVTGDHDDIGVLPSDVGAGLQSVLDIAAASVILSDARKNLIVAVEEPEAFLHPSMQRNIARTLLSSSYGYKTLVSTHSPILVEEAKYENILLAVDRDILAPKTEDDPTRRDIHSALLNGQGAEMIFASSVLLVEGDGDRAFFEGLRRRLAERDSSGRIDNLFVIQVAGNTSFAPWIKLLHALNGGSTSGPMSYLIVPDGDATSEIQRALNESNVSLPRDAHVVLQSARAKFADGDFAGWRSDLKEANTTLLKVSSPIPLCFLEGDLEFAMLGNLSGPQCRKWAVFWGIEFENKDAFLKRMGSKAIDGSAGNKYKQPYRRKQFAERIAFSNLSGNVRTILEAWLRNAGFSTRDTANLIKAVQ